MKLSEDGKAVILDSQYSHDPFITDKWQGIVDEVKAEFPGIDLIVFQCRGYVGMASITESLDPMDMAQKLMPKGIMVMGSQRKVNMMTSQQLADLLKEIQLD